MILDQWSPQKIMHTKKRHQNMFQDLNRKLHHAEKDRESPASDSKVSLVLLPKGIFEFVSCPEKKKMHKKYGSRGKENATGWGPAGSSDGFLFVLLLWFTGVSQDLVFWILCFQCSPASVFFFFLKKIHFVQYAPVLLPRCFFGVLTHDRL